MKISNKIINSNTNIKNIIFDWGGVITNIDYSLTEKAFQKLGLENFETLYGQFKQVDFFTDMEIGKISPEKFRSEIRKHLPNNNIVDNDLDIAWTAMLLDTPVKRLDLIGEVKKKYNTFLLSNTNKIHVDIYSKHIDKIYGFEQYRNLFNKFYLSHEVGLRKPNVEIFEFVLNENNLKSGETLFIDDTSIHIEGAKKAGIHTFHLVKPYTILDLFEN